MFAIFLSESMDPFYQNISSFPTVVFTFSLAICALYWAVAVLGLVDIDILDYEIPDVDGDLGINSDSGISNLDTLTGLMLKLGLYGVPITIIISFISLFGWIICYYLVHFLFTFIPGKLLHYIVGIPIFIGSLYVAAIITGQVTKLLRPLFEKAQQETVKHVLGQTAIVRTSRVDNSFGEATLEDGGAGLILKVRATGDNTFKKGDKVVLLEHIETENVYRVVSEEEFAN